MKTLERRRLSASMQLAQLQPRVHFSTRGPGQLPESSLPSMFLLHPDQKPEPTEGNNSPFLLPLLCLGPQSKCRLSSSASVGGTPSNPDSHLSAFLSGSRSQPPLHPPDAALLSSLLSQHYPPEWETLSPQTSSFLRHHKLHHFKPWSVSRPQAPALPPPTFL